MNSSSRSEVILTAKNIFFDYQLSLYQHSGLRDTFINALRNPWDFLFKKPEILPVLRGINFQLYKGDRLGLLGLNGAGKTTLCRILSGMMNPNAGEVICPGHVEAIFDVATGIMPELTGRENAYLLARLFYNTREVSKELVEEALEFSELSHFLDAPFKTYSKGMQARLVLSLISSAPSNVLILDEVFDGADLFFKEKIAKRMIKKIEGSNAVVFVSHGPDQVLELCNRVLVLKNGVIEFDGPPQEAINFYIQSGGSRSFAEL
jgi:ABC-type polysaccharide/polyol phosphate transport system ATPase subunit